jgi:hypothetical protein
MRSTPWAGREARWAELGPYRPREQTGRRPVIVRALTDVEIAELELATDEAIGQIGRD